MIRKLLSYVLRRLLPPLLLISMAGAGVWWLVPLARERPEPTPLTLERLSEVAQLLTLRVHVRQVMSCRIDGYTGGVEALLAVEGDVSLGVDLSAARLVDLGESSRWATLVLPPPRPTGARLDHDRTRIASLSRDGLWVIVPTLRPEAAVLKRALQEAQERVELAGESAEALVRSRTHAERVLATFCRSLGWTVEVAWADQTAGR